MNTCTTKSLALLVMLGLATADLYASDTKYSDDVIECMNTVNSSIFKNQLTDVEKTLVSDAISDFKLHMRGKQTMTAEDLHQNLLHKVLVGPDWDKYIRADTPHLVDFLQIEGDTLEKTYTTQAAFRKDFPDYLSIEQLIALQHDELINKDGAIVKFGGRLDKHKDRFLTNETKRWEKMAPKNIDDSTPVEDDPEDSKIALRRMLNDINSDIRRLEAELEQKRSEARALTLALKKL